MVAQRCSAAHAIHSTLRNTARSRSASVQGPDDGTGKQVYSIADPFKFDPLTARRGVTVSDEKIGAAEAMRILEDSKKMYAEDRAEQEAAHGK